MMTLGGFLSHPSLCVLVTWRLCVTLFLSPPSAPLLLRVFALSFSTFHPGGSLPQFSPKRQNTVKAAAARHLPAVFASLRRVPPVFPPRTNVTSAARPGLPLSFAATILSVLSIFSIRNQNPKGSAISSPIGIKIRLTDLNRSKTHHVFSSPEFGGDTVLKVKQQGGPVWRNWDQKPVAI